MIRENGCFGRPSPAAAYLREVFKPKKETPLQSLESLFAAIETEKK